MDRKCRQSVFGALLAVVSLVVSAGTAQAAVPQAGGLVQLPGVAHCYTASGNAGACTSWPQLGLPVSIAIAPGGKLAYVASGDVGSGTGEILTAKRDPSTGALVPVAGPGGCYSNTGASMAGAGTCTVAAGAGSGDATEAGGGSSTYELEGIQISKDGRFLYAASPKLNAIVWFAIGPASGGLTWSGCLTGTGTPGCSTATALLSPEALALSPDGQTLYASSYDVNELTVFHRDPATGALTQLPAPNGCVTSNGNAGDCTPDPLLRLPGPVVVSPDGRTLHVAQFSNNSVLTYTVGADGALSHPSGAAGCVQDPGSVTNGCSPLAPLNGAYALAGSPDGKQLYVGDYGSAGGIAALSTPPGGAPSLIGCAFESAPTLPAGCAAGAGLVDVGEVVAAPDGTAVYAADGNGLTCGSCGVVALARDPATGGLTQYGSAAGCQISQPTPSSAEANCGSDPVVQGPYAIAVSPDSNFVYAGGFASGVPGWLTAYQAVSRPSCQDAHATVAAGQTVTLPLTCTDLDGNPLAVSASGTPGHGTLGAIDQAHQTVQYTAASGYGGADAVGFSASDGTNSSLPATVQITVTGTGSGNTTTTTAAGGARTPVLSGLRISPRSAPITGRLVGNRCDPASAANSHDRRCTRTIALAVRYRLNVPARVVVTVDRVLPGRMAGHRCAAPGPSNRSGRKCVRLVAMRGMLTFHGKGGGNAFTFNGKVGRTMLAPGSYELVAIASSRGRTSLPETAAFSLT